MGTINLYLVIEEGGGPESYVAARHHGEALSLVIDLAGGEPEAEEFTVTHIRDEKCPDVKVQQSEDREKPDGYLLLELLVKAREKGAAELLSSSEF